jgi:hypothetical protein
MFVFKSSRNVRKLVNFTAIIVVTLLLILTLTGPNRFIPLFAMPSETDVRLKDKSLRKTA